MFVFICYLFFCPPPSLYCELHTRRDHEPCLPLSSPCLAQHPADNRLSLWKEWMKEIYFQCYHLVWDLVTKNYCGCLLHWKISEISFMFSILTCKIDFIKCHTDRIIRFLKILQQLQMAYRVKSKFLCLCFKALHNHNLLLLFHITLCFN